MTYYFLFHIICFVYCFWRFIKRYKKSSHDGVIGMYPAFDTFMALLFAPFLCVTDLIVTWVYMYIEWREEKRNQRKVF